MPVDVGSEFNSQASSDTESNFTQKFAIGAGVFMLAAAGLLTANIPDDPKDFEKLAQERLLKERMEHLSPGSTGANVQEAEIKMKARVMFEVHRTLSLATIVLSGGMGLALATAGAVSMGQDRRKNSKNVPQP